MSRPNADAPQPGILLLLLGGFLSFSVLHGVLGYLVRSGRIDASISDVGFPLEFALIVVAMPLVYGGWFAIHARTDPRGWDVRRDPARVIEKEDEEPRPEPSGEYLARCAKMILIGGAVLESVGILGLLLIFMDRATMIGFALIAGGVMALLLASPRVLLLMTWYWRIVRGEQQRK